MKKKIFISYCFGDATFKGEVAKWLEESGIEVLSVNKKDFTPEIKEQTKTRIKEQIPTCHALIVLVGNDTHSNPFIDYEISVARSKQIPTLWIRLPNRFGAAPEEIRKLAPIPFHKTHIQNLLSK